MSGIVILYITSLITTLKFGMAIVFLMIIASSFRDQVENARILMGNYFVAFVRGITFLPIVLYFVLSFRNK